VPATDTATWAERAIRESEECFVDRCWEHAPPHVTRDGEELHACRGRAADRIRFTWNRLGGEAYQRCAATGAGCCLERVSEDFARNEREREACDERCALALGHPPRPTRGCAPVIAHPPTPARPAGESTATRTALAACRTWSDLSRCDHLPTDLERIECRPRCRALVEAAETEVEIVRCAERTHRGEPLQCSVPTHPPTSCEDACHLRVYGPTVRRARTDSPPVRSP